MLEVSVNTNAIRMLSNITNFSGRSGQLSRYSDLLRAGRSGIRTPVRARFSLPVQTGHRGPSNLLYNAYRAHFQGVKRQGLGVYHPPLSSGEVKGRVKLYYSRSGPSRPVIRRNLHLQTLLTEAIFR
jgi:hypothetical protein